MWRRFPGARQNGASSLRHERTPSPKQEQRTPSGDNRPHDRPVAYHTTTPVDLQDRAFLHIKRYRDGMVPSAGVDCPIVTGDLNSPGLHYSQLDGSEVITPSLIDLVLPMPRCASEGNSNHGTADWDSREGRIEDRARMQLNLILAPLSTDCAGL